MARHAARPWAWGHVDCSMTLADWVVENGHPDPVAAWRGAYASEDEWRAIVDARGGLFPLVSDLCARAGLSPVAAPAYGAIAVIGSSHIADRQWAAIHDGAAWQVRLESGFVAMTARPLGIWSVN